MSNLGFLLQTKNKTAKNLVAKFPNGHMQIQEKAWQWIPGVRVANHSTFMNNTIHCSGV